MLLVIFGTPSLLTQWVVNFANTLVDVVEGSPVYIPAMSIESLKEQWQNRGEKSVVFHSDTPRKEVIELFQRSGAPIVVVWEPVAVVADFVSATRSLDIQTAARFTTQSVCTLAELVTQSDAWVVDSKMATIRLSDFIDRFLSYHQIEIDSAKRQGLVLRLSGSDRSDTTIAECMLEQKKLIQQPPAGNSIEKDAYFSSVLGQYDKVIEGKIPKKFVWPREAFVSLEDLSYVKGPVDLTGPARVLIGGHALSIPRGRWRATATISVWDNDSGNRIYSDVFAEDSVAAAVTSTLPVSGRFQFSLDFDCRDPYYPLIFRIALSEGAIEGRLDLESVSFESL